MRASKFLKVRRCKTGKIIHRTMNGAVIHAIRLDHSKSHREAKGVYECKRCGFYHVGGTREASKV